MLRKTKALSLASTRRPEYQVFVSHATADKWIAKTLCKEMEARGATTFRDDRDIAGGDSIPEEIRRQIKRSREVVVLLTPQSVGRQWVQLEIGAAWGWSKNTRIVVLRYHVEVDSIPPVVEKKRSYELNEVDQYLKELARRVTSSRKSCAERRVAAGQALGSRAGAKGKGKMRTRRAK